MTTGAGHPAETVATDVLTPRLAAGYAAMLDRDISCREGDPAPPLAHWSLAPENAATGALCRDGHLPGRGRDLLLAVPVPLPRRMWAAGDIRSAGRSSSA